MTPTARLVLPAAAATAVLAYAHLRKWRQSAAYQFKAALSIARKLPKTELHLHLDGSLPFEFIAKRAKARGIECPATPQGLREMVDKMKAARTAQAASADAREITRVGVGKNWAIFDYMNMFLQTADELEEATCLLATSLKTRQNVRSVAAAPRSSRVRSGRPVAVPPTRAAPLLRARCGWRRSASARRCTRSKA